MPFRVFLELGPGFLGGLAAGEGDQVDELAPLAVFFVERGPEPDQLGAVLLQEPARMVAEPLVQVGELALVGVIRSQLEDAMRADRSLLASASPWSRRRA